MRAARCGPRDVELDADGVRGMLVTPRGEEPFASPLLGRFNLSNLLAAAAARRGARRRRSGRSSPGSRRSAPLPGRLEPVARGQPFPVLVDYAHTDDALAAALARDARARAAQGWWSSSAAAATAIPGKRPLMGRAAGELADLPIVTSDNPRSEDPLAILARGRGGPRSESGNGGYRIVPDRREAIRGAIAIGAARPRTGPC